MNDRTEDAPKSEQPKSDQLKSEQPKPANIIWFIVWVLLATLCVWLVVSGLTGNWGRLLLVPLPLILMHFVKRRNMRWKH